MAAETRQDPGAIFVVDVECGIEEDWGEDVAGADLRVAEHNEVAHPLAAADSVGG